MASAIGSYATASALKTMIGITDSNDDTLIGLICDRVNQIIETTTHRVLAPIASTTYLYDGNGGTSLFLPLPTDKAPIGGVRAVTLVEVQLYTGAGYITVNSTDYFLRQRIGMTGPYERLIFTDAPTGGVTCWPAGFNTVRITATAGWAAIPDDITDMALRLAQRVWNARQVGFQDAGGLNAIDEQGQPIVSRYLSRADRDLLRTYTLAGDLA